MDLIKTSSLAAGIFHISLNRPDQLNALSQEVLQHFLQILQQVKQNKSVRAILLTGEGKAFCAGADIKQLEGLTGESGLAFAEFGQKVFDELEWIGKPSVAAIQGFAFGGGLELAMASTLRIAANNAVFGQPEVKLGVMPGFGGTKRLSSLIGKGRALDVCLSGRRFSAEEAYQWGLVNESVEPSDLMDRAIHLLTEFTKLSPIALQHIMTVIHKGYDLTLTDALALEAAHFGLCCSTKDKREGVNAFLEKRTAVFSGE